VTRRPLSSPQTTAEPHVEILIPLEGLLTVRYFAMTEPDAERLRLWLERRRDLLALIFEATDYTGGTVAGPPGGSDWIMRAAA
jgi:hypothetical protein